jgi:small subunit ribosomal protein S20
MANIKSAIKRARQNKKLRLHNASARSALRTAIKKVNNLLTEQDYAKAKEAFITTQPVIDKAAAKGLIHKNKAARLKSNMSAKIKKGSLATAVTAS